MDPLLSTLLVSSIPSLAAMIGVFWTIYRSRHTTTRQAGRDLIHEQEERIKWRDQEIARLTKENESLQQQCAAYLRALAAVKGMPVELIKYQMQNGGSQQK